MPSQLMDYVELVLDGDKLIETKRLPGENDVGMVAWKVTLNTPEYPSGLFFVNKCTSKFISVILHQR